jgi:hypothetical protein
MPNFSRSQAQRPEKSLNGPMLAFLAGMVALWTIMCAISHRAPDLDGMEELVWASSLELGYLKHPPFPSWIMHGLTQIFGRPAWLTFLAGQLFSALALWFIWLLAREMVSVRKAFMVTLLVSTTIYFSLRGTIFNHNTAQLWAVTASTWLVYRALRTQRLSSWLWLGAVCGLGMMSKYSIVIQFTAYFLFMVRQGCLKHAETWKGLGVALLAFLIVVSPHAYWLVVNEFGPLRYANDSLEALNRLASLKHLLDFTLDQAARLSPMIVVWLAWRLWMRRSSKPSVYPLEPQVDRKKRYISTFSDWDRSFLLWIGLTPFVATVLVSGVLGTRLVASWGTTFFVLYGFFVLWWMYGHEQANLRRIAIIVIAVHVLMALGYALGRGPLAWYSGRDTRSMFPGAIISKQMQDNWNKHVPDQPLRLVASDTWLGGNIAIHAGPHVQVFINGRYEESPWLQPDTALDCGALLVYSIKTRGEPADSLKTLYGMASWQGQDSILWSSPKSPEIDLNWAIIAPNAECRQ